MKLPSLAYGKQKYKNTNISFGGINYSQNYNEGEMRNCYGLSTDNYPCLSQRPKRSLSMLPNAATSIYHSGKLAVIDGNNFIYNGDVKGTVEAGEKMICDITNRILIFPDKKYYDVKEKVFGRLEASVTLNNVSLSGGVDAGNNAKLNFGTGYKYSDYVSGTEMHEGVEGDTFEVYAVSGIKNGKFDVESYGETPVESLNVGDILYASDSMYDKIVSITYREETNEDDGEPIYIYELHVETHEILAEPMSSDALDVLKEGDGVEIVGATYFSDEETDKSTDSGIKDAPKTLVIREIGEGFIRFDANVIESVPETVTIKRSVPDFVCVCEYENRIWGATADNIIYASALGDPFNFSVYEGAATDSYALAIGSEGEFTACVGYSGGVIFFKEKCAHKIIGGYPAAYSLYSYNIHGVQKGCGRSLSIINEVLFYKGINGVYAYSGGVPNLISDNFGTRSYDKAVGGSLGDKYYISMRDRDSGEWALYAYDSRINMWLVEDNTRVIDFAEGERKLYYIDGNTGSIMTIEPFIENDNNVEWGAEFCPIYENLDGRSSYSKLYICIEAARGSYCGVYVSFDNQPFMRVAKIYGKTDDLHTIPISLNRCNKFVLKLEGRGQCIIRSIVREFALRSSR